MKMAVQENISFRTCIQDLYRNELVRSMKDIEHHKNVSCFEHSLKVAYISFKIAKKRKLDYVSIARAGFLHDFYLYDWHEKGSHKGLHGFHHAKIALHHAQEVTTLNQKEVDIIMKHMWPLNLVPPRYLESWIVTTVDKMVSLREVLRLH